MKKLLPFLTSAALVASLASCSSEPSDWRSDKKVSLDEIPPGTRPSDNFDQATDAPSQEKGGAIARPINSATTLDKRAAPSAGAVMTADTQEGTAQKPGEGKPKAKAQDGGSTNTSDAPNAPEAGHGSDDKGQGQN